MHLFRQLNLRKPRQRETGSPCHTLQSVDSLRRRARAHPSTRTEGGFLHGGLCLEALRRHPTRALGASANWGRLQFRRGFRCRGGGRTSRQANQFHQRLAKGAGLRREPAGRTRIFVCDSISCELCGGEALMEQLSQALGIQPGEEQKIFDEFYRSDNAKVREVKGTGLGLAIVKKIVGDNGGVVRAEPAQGSGLRVVVELPLAR